MRRILAALACGSVLLVAGCNDPDTPAAPVVPTTPVPRIPGTSPGTSPGSSPGTSPGGPTTGTPPVAPTRFRVASFNVLGASHTTDCHDRTFCTPGRYRAGLAVRVLQALRIDVAGLQEFEPSQYAGFVAATSGTWGVYPGLKYGDRSLANSIAWDKRRWQLVFSETFQIPYFEGRLRAMPSVLLRNRATGRVVAFVNVHNPANTRRFPQNRVWREQALSIEVRQLARYRKAGYPIVMTGDFNAVVPPFCAMTGRAGLHASSGGSVRPCAPDPIANVDWIFGSAGVSFADFRKLKTPLVQRTTDHPIVVATATIPAGAR